MKIYLAAPSETQKVMRALRVRLVERGYTITSEWLDEGNMRGPLRSDMATRDIANLRDSDVVVVFNPRDFENKGTGGRHSELAFGIAYRKHVIVLGRPTNVFHLTPGVRLAPTVPDLLTILERIRCGTPSSSAA